MNTRGKAGVSEMEATEASQTVVALPDWGFGPARVFREARADALAFIGMSVQLATRMARMVAEYQGYLNASVCQKDSGLGSVSEPISRNLQPNSPAATAGETVPAASKAGRAGQAYLDGVDGLEDVAADFKGFNLEEQDPAGICRGGGYMDVATNGIWEGTLDQLLGTWVVEEEQGAAIGVVENTDCFGFGTACIFVAAAGWIGSAVRVTVHGKCADAKSLKEVLALGIESGDQLEIEARGDGADGAVRDLVELVRNRYGIK